MWNRKKQIGRQRKKERHLQQDIMSMTLQEGYDCREQLHHIATLEQQDDLTESQ